MTESFSQRVNDFENLRESSDFYELKKQFCAIMQESGIEILTSDVGTTSKDRGKKVIPYHLWKIKVEKSH